VNETDKANEIDKEIRESDALGIYNRLMYLNNIFYIYERNYFEFEKLLTAFHTPQIILPLFDEEKRDDFHLLINELIRYLHNYVTSAATLKDHARIMIRAAYKNSEFLAEYQTKIDNVFTNDPISVFVQDLRNYTLHCALPATFSQIQFLQDQKTKQQIPITRALLDKDSLLHGYKWKPASKEYLAEAPDEIDLLVLLNTHHDKYVSFYDWLINRLKDIHGDELEWLQKKTNELSKILEPIYKQP
jgi:hypothetical protein